MKVETKRHTITAKEVFELTGINANEVLEVLLLKAKELRCATVSTWDNGLELIYFTRMANGRTGVLKVCGSNNGQFTGLEVVGLERKGE